MQPSDSSVISDHDWPSNGLESVGSCLVCGSAAYRLIHQDLTDTIFGTAPGKWNMYQCSHCLTAYLNPRPTLETIALAYRSYYTHQAVAPDGGDRDIPLTFWRLLRRSLRNGYLNSRFGLQHRPANPWGAVVLRLFPGIRLEADYEFRNLRRPHPGAALLDIGCGNGAFLKRMQTAGWEVAGLDPDPAAVAACHQAGLSVQRGVLTESTFPSQSFDAITLSHVMEHLHAPRETLRICNQLLRPGGQLWMATPNIQSVSHADFGPSWRGLEIPRHLVIFNRGSIRLALTEAGFQSIRFSAPTFPHTAFFYEASYALSQQKPIGSVEPPRLLRFKARLAGIRAWLGIGEPEEIIVSAVKA